MVEAMQRKGYSFRDLAFLTGRNAGYLCRVAKGTRRPSKITALRIAEVLEIKTAVRGG